MKQQTSRQPTDEREKMRRFRELDDAFSEALRQLDDPDNDFNIPTGPPVRSLASLERQEQEDHAEQQHHLQEVQQREQRQRLADEAKAREREFERRLHELMADYSLSAETVSHLLTSLESKQRVD